MSAQQLKFLAGYDAGVLKPGWAYDLSALISGNGVLALRFEFEDGDEEVHFEALPIDPPVGTERKATLRVITPPNNVIRATIGLGVPDGEPGIAKFFRNVRIDPE